MDMPKRLYCPGVRNGNQTCRNLVWHIVRWYLCFFYYLIIIIIIIIIIINLKSTYKQTNEQT